MSTSATGRLVNEHGQPWKAFTVEVWDPAWLFEVKLGKAVSEPDGRFSMSYRADAFASEFGPRRLSLRVYDKVHRLLSEQDVVDVLDDVLAIGEIEIRTADASGWLVTRGTGKPDFVSSGNAVWSLIDNVEAWAHLSKWFQNASKSIEFMQLDFAIPEEFVKDPEKEKAVLVFAFERPPPTSADLRKVTDEDVRPERLLLRRAESNVAIRMLLDHINYPEIPVLHGLLLWIHDPTKADDIAKYFEQADAQTVTSSPFLPFLISRLHAKLAFVDAHKVMSIGSPFSPGWLDDPRHAIDEPRRGPADEVSPLPIHDVSLAAQGRVVAHAYEAFRLHWNAALPDEDADEKLGPIEDGTEEPDPVEDAEDQPGGTDTVFAGIQVVRTLNAEVFDDHPQGEKGILEGYLRAIANAERFIYCENQYFTNPAIARALVAALADPERPHLRVIIALNIKPNFLTYPRQQQVRINDMFAALADKSSEQEGEQPREDLRKRLGVFTRWTYERADPPRRPRPRIAPVYLHSKVAIVDDRWATVGSANLDGASLDRTDLWAIPEFMDERHSDLSFNLLNGIAGQQPTTAVESLRRRLWSEHLGFESADDAELAPASGEGALRLWTVRADAAVEQLRTKPTQAPQGPMVLGYPVGESLDLGIFASHEEPLDHLEAVGLDRRELIKHLDVIRAVRGFSYDTGEWLQDGPQKATAFVPIRLPEVGRFT